MQPSVWDMDGVSTVLWFPLNKKRYSNVFVLLRQKSGAAAGSGGIETYRNGVWCEVLSVENCNGKNT